MDNKYKKSVSYSVVRIIANVINFNWNIPFQYDQPSKGQGTGFFIDCHYILTCGHVVSNSKNIYFEIPSKNSGKYECELVSICPYFDIALLKTKDYKSDYYVKLGDSDKLKIGLKVDVVGYPVGFSGSNNIANNLKITTGILSGMQKKYIQTDSPINPGNSGGPLFCDGVVVGINGSKLVGDDLENIGFSIPINNYKIIKDDLLKNSIVYRPNLLITYNNTDTELIKNLTNNKIKNGILISQILDKSIFKKCGIKKDCILTAIGGYQLDNYGLTNKKWLDTNMNIDIILSKFKNNSNIQVEYYEKKVLKKLKINLEPFIPPIRDIFPTLEEVKYFVVGGMVFMNLTTNHINKDNVKVLCNFVSKDNDYYKPKLILSYVFPNTKANILNNLKNSDIITKVNGYPVNNIEGFTKNIMKPIIINRIPYIKIENKEEKVFLMSVSDVIQQDMVFSEIYKYDLNKFHTQFRNK